jgi:hypothetical protein
MELWPPHFNHDTLWRCAVGEISGDELTQVSLHLAQCNECRLKLDVIYQAVKPPKPLRKGQRPPAATAPVHA